MSNIYLGNLSIFDIEKVHDFKFSEDEKTFLQQHWHMNANFEDGESGWHMFDIPPTLSLSKGDIGKKCLDIFMAHNNDFNFSFLAGYGNKTEND